MPILAHATVLTAPVNIPIPGMLVAKYVGCNVLTAAWAQSTWKSPHTLLTL